MLPQRKKPIRSGIERAPPRDFPRHRAFVRKHCCVVTLGKIHDDCDGPIECAHVRIGGGGGIGLKPHDAFTVSACRKHHAEQHRIGEISFVRKYAIDTASIAREFAMKSPCPEVREYASASMKSTQRSSREGGE